MTAELNINAGDMLATAQISPCVGGLVRTWVDGGEPRLWATPDADWLLHTQGTGQIARTLQGERRFREAALLSTGGATLLVQSRFPKKNDDGYSAAANAVRLEPAVPPTESVDDDFRMLLAQAVRHCVAKDEFLVVEKGGWDAPNQPYCMFSLTPDEETIGLVSVVETAPAPVGAKIWQPHNKPGNDVHSASAPASPETLAVVPAIMLDAIATWGLEPWDLALTFGKRE